MGIGDAQKARQEIDAVLAIAPNNPDARYQAGYLAWTQKDYKRAEQVFDDLYKANPKDSRGMIGLVETMASQNHMADAIKLLQDSIARQPERRDFQLALANLYVRDQRYDDAVKLLQGLLKTEPKSADLLLRLAETAAPQGRCECRDRNLPPSQPGSAGRYPAPAAAGPADGWHRPPRPGQADL